VSHIRPISFHPLLAVARGTRWLGGLLAAVFRRIFAHNVTGHASQFAYNAFLATVPFFFVLVATVGLVASDTFPDDLIRDFGKEIPDEFERLLKSALAVATGNTRTAVIALAIGVVAGLYVVSNVMVTLMGALDNAYGVRHRPWLRGRLVGLGLAAGVSVLAMLTTLALVGGPDLVDGFLEVLGVEGGTPVRLARRSIFLLGIGALVMMTLILYRFGPNTRVHRFLEILPGALVAVAAWIGTSRLFRLFFDNFDAYNNVYGGLATVVVYLWYLYMSGIVLLIGGELNGELAKRRAIREATRVRVEAEAQEATAITRTSTSPLPLPVGEPVEPPSASQLTEESTAALPRPRG